MSTAPPLASADGRHLYQDLAGQMLRLIDGGTYRPGDRIPSVRDLSRSREVSITTVLEAYRLLENGGYIEARPQSGYFVRARLLEAPAEPRVTKPPEVPRPVTTRDLTLKVLRTPADPSLIQFGLALPPREILPIEKLNRILARVGRGPKRALFEAPAGTRELRAQVARRALASGCPLTPQEVLITNGAQEAIYFALGAVCKPGDTVAVESPTYLGFLQAIAERGLKALEIKSYPREGICLDEIKRAVRRHKIAAFLLVTNFSNPLGSCLPDAKKEALVKFLANEEIPLIEDDVTGDLPHGPERPKVAKSWDRKGLVLLCSSFTKTLAPGYRIGWIAPGRFQDEVEHAKIVTNLSTAPLPQLAIAEFLAGGGYDRHLRKVRRIYAHNVAMMVETVARSFPEGTRVTHPRGGFVVWVEMPTSVDALRLYERALKAGIAISPGPLFSAKGNFRHHIRLSASAWNEKRREAVEKLGRLAVS